jgi:C_GCAxxG_C_C family probable redox protein
MRPEKARKMAVDTYESGYNCAQSVVATYNAATGAHLPLGPFAAMGKGFFSGCVCGPLSGAEACIGHMTAKANGKVSPDTKKLAKRLHAKFTRKFGSACCRDISKGLKPDSDEQFDHCSKVVAFCASEVVNLAKKRK